MLFIVALATFVTVVVQGDLIPCAAGDGLGCITSTTFCCTTDSVTANALVLCNNDGQWSTVDCPSGTLCYPDEDGVYCQ
jgi:hypothetical protein